MSPGHQVFSTVAGLQNVTSLSGPTGISNLPITSVQSAPITSGPLITGPVEPFTTVSIPGEGAATSMVSKPTSTDGAEGPSASSKGDNSAGDTASNQAQPKPVAMETEECKRPEGSISPEKKPSSSVCVKQEALPMETGEEDKATVEGQMDNSKGNEFLKDQPREVTTKMEVEEDGMSMC